MLCRLVDEGEVLWLEAEGQVCYAGETRFRVVAREGRFLAVKRPGRKYWAGLAQQQGYAPTSFVVFECQYPSNPDDPNSLWVTRLDIPLRA